MYAHKDDQVIMMCFPKLRFLKSRGLPEPSGRDVKKLWTVLETVTGLLSLVGDREEDGDFLSGQRYCGRVR